MKHKTYLGAGILSSIGVLTLLNCNVTTLGADSASVFDGVVWAAGVALVAIGGLWAGAVGCHNRAADDFPAKEPR